MIWREPEIVVKAKTEKIQKSEQILSLSSKFLGWKFILTSVTILKGSSPLHIINWLFGNRKLKLLSNIQFGILMIDWKRLLENELEGLRRILKERDRSIDIERAIMKVKSYILNE